MPDKHLADRAILVRRMGLDQEKWPGALAAEPTTLQGEDTASFDVHLDEGWAGPGLRPIEEPIQGDAVDDEPRGRRPPPTRPVGTQGRRVMIASHEEVHGPGAVDTGSGDHLSVPDIV